MNSSALKNRKLMWIDRKIWGMTGFYTWFQKKIIAVSSTKDLVCFSIDYFYYYLEKA